MSKTTICIPVFNAKSHVENLIKDLEKTEAAACPIIFCDDNSTEDVSTPILEFMKRNPKVQYLRNQSQQLFTRNVNRLARATEPDTDYICFLNTDCELAPGWLTAMVDKIESTPNVAIIGYPDGEPDDHPEQEVFYPTRDGHPDYVTGHCLLIPRTILEEHGVFCETDMDQAHIASERIWCWRILSMGYRAFYIHKPLVKHRIGGPSWGRNLGWLYTFLQAHKLWRGRDVF